MKRLVTFLFVICLSGSVLFISSSSAEISDTQVMETSSIGDVITTMDVSQDCVSYGDPDDAITGNRGPTDALLADDSVFGSFEQNLLDLWLIQFMLGLISF